MVRKHAELFTSQSQKSKVLGGMVRGGQARASPPHIKNERLVGNVPCIHIESCKNNCCESDGSVQARKCERVNSCLKALRENSAANHEFNPPLFCLTVGYYEYLEVNEGFKEPIKFCIVCTEY